MSQKADLFAWFSQLAQIRRTYCLDSLSKAHFIGKNAIHSVFEQLDQPVDTEQLVVTHFTSGNEFRLDSAH